MKNKRIFGLLGRNISHSFSPGYFNDKFQKEGIDAEYRLFDLEQVERIQEIIQKEKNLEGFNVTIPYKQKIIELLDAVDDTAATIGAVNVVKIERSSSGLFLKGYNTDATGFRQSLEPLITGKKPLEALVLGTGGAYKAVHYTLEKLEIPFIKVSRSKKDDTVTYDELTKELIGRCKLIVNTTPLGMHPKTEAFPDIPYEYITAEHILYDLIYNPLKTKFLELGESRGATIKNGLEMLHKQAEAAWEIWNTMS